MRAPATRRGFTLIELLVVIAIIAVLIALLLPAVQAAREAARRSNCVNNLKQLALASMNYHDVNNVFPTQIGFPVAPGLGTSMDTRVSWLTQILPQMEQTPLYNAYNFSWFSATDSVWNSLRNTTVIYSKVATFICPSYAGDSTQIQKGDYSTTLGLAPNITGAVAITTYKGNLGDNTLNLYSTLIPGYTVGILNAFGDPAVGTTGQPTARGMFWRGTMAVGMNSVVDGTSNTILAGDAMPLDKSNLIAPFTSWADSNQAVAVTSIALNWKYPVTVASSTIIPTTADSSFSFRSNHSGGANFAYADGSVHFLKDSISAITFRALSSRAGGEVVSSDSY
ncbi:prepilin-type N-terminal cleavage/methylation domain-containing protein/prepilin-type processing-associated H-X9-DG domain-containing protein [Singulisphaera sp. GP187]|uniref:DUF1559 domain-containing protein n=1 Tax=Singulisphaera sp. GP187 TaxID=1882752 RepID=UPI000929FCA3|nr:DUF1559 domain-containing protein [Singulisphaera sp. GP187]SIO43856.1 prepilin-type N-terminal cleavage/methylation domain-containing protein/prepilin-type processing-associated H-X9-DG domain-containing protein [Singulisphaera sp. GP187]